MFDRKKYKYFAKKQLKGRLAVPAMAVLISFIIMALVNSRLEFRSTALRLIVSLIAMFISGIIVTALSNLFLAMYESPKKQSFAKFIEGFDCWDRACLGAFWFSLWVSLWSILFIIPGIVKSISYSQMFFIIAENPYTGPAKAMRLSKIITRGFKADLLIMYLSFILWDILSVFTLGILQLWIIPYKMMSFTNAYKAMKHSAIRRGELSERDFSGEYYHV